jgi:hypothetical protein
MRILAGEVLRAGVDVERGFPQWSTPARKTAKPPLRMMKGFFHKWSVAPEKRDAKFPPLDGEGTSAMPLRLHSQSPDAIA